MCIAKLNIGGVEMFSQAGHEILVLLSEERRWWYSVDLFVALGERIKQFDILDQLFHLQEQGFVESRMENDREYQPRYEGEFRRELYRITHGGISASMNKEKPGPSLVPV